MRRDVTVAALAVCGVVAVVAIALSTRFPSSRHAAAMKRAEERAEPALSRVNGSRSPGGALRLENLGSVPLSEVADLLRSRSGGDVERLALDLQKLRGTRASAAVTQFFKAWAEIDPEAALRTALKFSDVVTKEMALGAVVANAAPQAIAQLTRELADAPQNSLPARFRSDLLGHAVVRWSENDPAAAAQFFDQHPEVAIDVQGVPFAANQLAANWARIDPEAALSWASKQSDANSAIQGAIGGWWENDPKAAADYAKQHLDTFENQKLAGIVASRMASQDPQKAAEWVAQLPPEARRSAEMGVAFAWARRDPQAASDWALTLPEKDRSTVLGPISAEWSMSDPQAAGQWLGSLQGAGRDEAVGTYSNAIAALDPATALSWAATMENERMRNDVMRRVISDWYGRDPDAAKKWLAQSNLSAEQQARLLGAPPGP